MPLVVTCSSLAVRWLCGDGGVNLDFRAVGRAVRSSGPVAEADSRLVDFDADRVC